MRVTKKFRRTECGRLRSRNSDQANQFMITLEDKKSALSEMQVRPISLTQLIVPDCDTVTQSSPWMCGQELEQKFQRSNTKSIKPYSAKKRMRGASDRANKQFAQQKPMRRIHAAAVTPDKGLYMVPGTDLTASSPSTVKCGNIVNLLTETNFSTVRNVGVQTSPVRPLLGSHEHGSSSFLFEDGTVVVRVTPKQESPLLRIWAPVDSSPVKNQPADVLLLSQGQPQGQLLLDQQQDQLQDHWPRDDAAAAQHAPSWRTASLGYENGSCDMWRSEQLTASPATAATPRLPLVLVPRSSYESGGSDGEGCSFTAFLVPKSAPLARLAPKVSLADRSLCIR